MLKNKPLLIAIIFIVISVMYWSLFASNRYVSESHIFIQRTELASGQSLDFSSLLGGVGGAQLSDQLLLRDYLLSVDMLLKLQKALNLREHYSNKEWDILSRLWEKDISLEWFHKYVMSRIFVDYDSEAGVLNLQVQAFEPDFANQVARFMLKEGERYMNELAQNIARVQVDFLEKQVVDLNERVIQAQKKIINYQNSTGIVSPEGDIQNFSEIISSLNSSLAKLQTEKTALLSYVVPDSAKIIEIDEKIKANRKQIEKERAKLVSPEGGALNRQMEVYQRLQLEAGFAEDLYKTALVSLEKGRLEATRTLKKMSVLQQPTLPQYPIKPERIYNCVISILFALLVAGIVNLIILVVRDHRD